jgi:hypothetical protein
LLVNATADPAIAEEILDTIEFLEMETLTEHLAGKRK